MGFNEVLKTDPFPTLFDIKTTDSDQTWTPSRTRIVDFRRWPRETAAVFTFQRTLLESEWRLYIYVRGCAPARSFAQRTRKMWDIEVKLRGEFLFLGFGVLRAGGRQEW